MKRLAAIAAFVCAIAPALLIPFGAKAAAIAAPPGHLLEHKGVVQHTHPPGAATRVPARKSRTLELKDLLDVEDKSWAVVRFHDASQIRVRELSLIEVVEPVATARGYAFKILKGELYYFGLAKSTNVQVLTARNERIRPDGTDFLIRVSDTETEVLMFDGEAEVANDLGTVTIHRGERAVAEPGKIPVRAAIQAKNVVQWWIYYPAVLDPGEIPFTEAERFRLASSLDAYREGDIAAALEKFPGYPNPSPLGSDAEKLYFAELLLSVGSVAQAEIQLSQVSSNAPLARALRTMIAAVQSPVAADVRRLSPVPLAHRMGEGSGVRVTSSEFLALSYHHQSTNGLPQALAAARAVTTNSPQFGFGWARVAELEFSFGRTRAAREAVERALHLSPSNAQAHAVKGFLLAADNKLRDAIASFDRAIEIDPALGNAWLGRGLCKRRLSWSIFSFTPTGGEGRREGARDNSAIRNPKSEMNSSLSPGERAGVRANPFENQNSKFVDQDWLSDLQTAAILEPTRSLTRSYLGKAFTDAGLSEQAFKELAVAKHFDTNDPTPRLYSALLNREENRINESVRDLEKSIELNDNRALYRSRLLLDEDRAVRSSSLATLYQDAGMNEVAVREAARAVSYDYANYSAHLFLSDSYNALRDPTRFNLRYETVWFNELLLANLLSPVGGTPLSQHISQQEYARLFDHNRIGMSTDSSYRSDGQYRELASQFGVIGSTAWSLDLDYQHNNGVRPNNGLDRAEWYTTIKQQLTPQDSFLLLTKYQDYRSGDNFQYYYQTNARPHFRFDEFQHPIVVGGYQHEWVPGVHTLVLGGRLANEQTVSDQSAAQLVLNRRTFGQQPGLITSTGQPGLDVDYHSKLEVYTVELQQIFDTQLQTFLFGGRWQSGTFDTKNLLTTNLSTALGFPFAFPSPAANTNIVNDFERLSAYVYETVKLPFHLRVTGGLTYEHLDFPENFRNPPVKRGEEKRERLNPKVGLAWDPLPEVSLRGIYARSLGGVSLDESFRLEPAQLAGFSQDFRTLIPESLFGSVAAPNHEVLGGALEFKFKTHTYLAFYGEKLRSDVNQTVGVFDNFYEVHTISPSTTGQRLDYDERSAGVTLNQLLCKEWSIGAQYQFIRSDLTSVFPSIPLNLASNQNTTNRADLHRLELHLLFNRPSGLFALAESEWYFQNNRQNTLPSGTALPNDSFQQFNLFLGYRFPKQRGDISLGVLNLTGEDYHLNPVTPHAELPRDRVFYARLRLRF